MTLVPPPPGDTQCSVWDLGKSRSVSHQESEERVGLLGVPNEQFEPSQGGDGKKGTQRSPITGSFKGPSRYLKSDPQSQDESRACCTSGAVWSFGFLPSI